MDLEEWRHSQPSLRRYTYSEGSFSCKTDAWWDWARLSAPCVDMHVFFYSSSAFLSCSEHIDHRLNRSYTRTVLSTSLRPSLCPSLPLSVPPSVRPYLSPSLFLSVSTSLSVPPVRPFLRPYLSVRLSLCPSLPLSPSLLLSVSISGPWPYHPLSVPPSLSPSLTLSVLLSPSLPLCPSLCPSVRNFVSSSRCSCCVYLWSGLVEKVVLLLTRIYLERLKRFSSTQDVLSESMLNKTQVI